MTAITAARSTTSRIRRGGTRRTQTAPATDSTIAVKSMPRPSGRRTTSPPSPAVNDTPTPCIDQSIAFQSVSSPLVDPAWRQPPWRVPESAPAEHPWLPWAARTRPPMASPCSATPTTPPSPQTTPALTGLRRASRRKAPTRLMSGRAAPVGDCGGGGSGAGGSSPPVPA